MTFSAMIEGADGSFGAYIAQPSQPNGAALIVIQEIFGVNEVMREVATYYASLGYVAIVPDLFWRIEPGISITDKTPEDMTKAYELFGKFDTAKGVTDLQAAIDFARAFCPRVGTVGYCLGGLMAYLVACETNVDASVSYYGVSIDAHIAAARSIARPLMLHVASQDKFVSKKAQVMIAEMASNHSKVEMHIYQGLDHAFSRPGGEHYDMHGAKTANDRTAEFFTVHLL